MADCELMHHGIIGMKWGVRRKRNKGKLSEDSTTKKDESPEEKKERILRAGSAKEVYKNRELFNNRELNDVYNRLNTENNIKRLVEENSKMGSNYVKKFIDTSYTVDRFISTVEKDYRNAKKTRDFIKSMSNVTGIPSIKIQYR